MLKTRGSQWRSSLNWVVTREDSAASSRASRYQQLIDDSAQETLEAAVRRLEGFPDADLSTYATLLRRCSREKSLVFGRRVHSHIRGNGRLDVGDNLVFMSNLLIQMYGKCSSLEEARCVFELLAHRRNLYSWSAMIAAFAQCGHPGEALRTFHLMENEGVKPNGLTFVAVLGACCKVGDLEKGRESHARIILTGGFFSNIAVANSLLTMYARCGLVDQARSIFDSMYLRNVVSWNSMIGAYAQKGQFSEAVQLFNRMGVEPDRVTHVAVLSACSGLGDLRLGEMIHQQIPANECRSDVVLGTALLNMYSKAGRVELAREVFDNLQVRDGVAWAAMIAAYAQNRLGLQALHLFRELDLEGVAPNQVTFISVVDACSDTENLELGKLVHQRIVLLGFERHVTVRNTLLNLYSSLGSLEETESLFLAQAERNTASWNVMIATYTGHGEALRALRLLHEMDLEGTRPDEVSFSGIFDACAAAGALRIGREAHARVQKTGFESDTAVGNSLINMYARCWSLAEAEQAFERILGRDLISWNSLIAAYAMHGFFGEALEAFRWLNLEGHLADHFTFTSTLFACSHAGLLKLSLQHFRDMVGDHGARPWTQHYGCIVDLLGRLGKLGEAEELMGSMPVVPDGVAWMSLLGACKTHSDPRKAAGCARKLVKLQPEQASPYVILKNMNSF